MKDINNPHDRLFKTVFSIKREAINFIKSFVNPKIVDGIDLRTFKEEPTSHVPEELQETVSDVVYSCKFKGTAIKICFLFEHKSYPVPYPHLQLLRYLLNCWEKDLAQKQPLRPVVPIILYHGKERWETKQLSDYFGLPDNTLLPYFPNFEYILTDLSKFSDEDILKLRIGFYINTLLLMKHQKDKAYFIANTDKIFINIRTHFTKEEQEKYIRIILIYLIKTSKFEDKERTQFMENLDKSTKETFVSTYDELIAIGEERGIAIGKEEGISIGKEQQIINMIEHCIKQFPDWTDETIANILNTTVALVKQIRTKQ